MLEQTLEFTSRNTICRGTLYRPETAHGNLPCIVMAHGFGLTHESGLAPFKKALCQAGYAVFAFDYRYFGDSDGKPRQLMTPKNEIGDYLSALNFARCLDGIDPGRMCLWGTSFSGGLVAAAAAKDGNVQCLICQCPMMDGMAATLQVIRYGGLRQLVKLSFHALIDLVRGAAGMRPHYVRSAGRPGEAAFMTAKDCFDGYLPLLADNAVNKVAARIGLYLPFFRPIAYARNVNCPALILVCRKDTVAPPSAALKAAARMPRAQIKHYPVGHFGIYNGGPLAISIKDQLDFLSLHLPV